jgi:hypothetical protein
MNRVHQESLALMEKYFKEVNIDDFLDSYLEIETFEGMPIDVFLDMQVVTKAHNAHLANWSKNGYSRPILTEAPLDACKTVDKHLTFNGSQNHNWLRENMPTPKIDFDKRLQNPLVISIEKPTQISLLSLTTLVRKPIHRASYAEQSMIPMPAAANESPYRDDFAEAA